MSTVLFESEIAQLVGVNSAIVFEKIRYFTEWAKKNKAKHHFHNGNWWTYNSLNAWVEELSFLTKKQIRTAIDLLIKNKLIETGCFNRKSYDKTIWYRPLVTKNVTYAPEGTAYAPEGTAYALQGTTIPNKSSNESSKKEVVVQKASTSSNFNENEGFEQTKAYFLGVPYYKRIKAHGAIRSVYSHYGSFESIKIAYESLWIKYTSKKRYPSQDEEKQNQWHTDCYSYIENAMIKESKK